MRLFRRPRCVFSMRTHTGIVLIVYYFLQNAREEAEKLKEAERGLRMSNVIPHTLSVTFSSLTFCNRRNLVLGYATNRWRDRRQRKSRTQPSKLL